MTVYDIEKQNFISILRSGAFEDSKPIGMLSDYKWKKLIELSRIHDVVQLFARGLEHYYYDSNMNLTDAHVRAIRTLLSQQPGRALLPPPPTLLLLPEIPFIIRIQEKSGLSISLPS